MHFGRLTDRDTVGDLKAIAGYIDESIRELLDIAGAGASDSEPSPQFV